MIDGEKINQIRAVLTTEVKWIISIILFVAGVVAPYYGIRQDIALIEKDISIINNNHEVHIQDIMKQLEENSKSIKENREAILIITGRK